MRSPKLFEEEALTLNYCDKGDRTFLFEANDIL